MGTPPPPPSYTVPIAALTRSCEPWIDVSHDYKAAQQSDLLALTKVRKRDTQHSQYSDNHALVRHRPRLIFSPKHAFVLILILVAALCASLTLFVQQSQSISIVEPSSHADSLVAHSHSRSSSRSQQRHKDEGKSNNHVGNSQQDERVKGSTDSQLNGGDTGQAQSDQPIIHKVSINTADVGQLETVKGIGPIMARRIVQYRQRIGTFTSIDQLLEVEGIGAKTLDKLRPSLVL